jgi:hypothetical protein
VTLKVQLPMLLFASVATQVTVVVPIAKVLPLAGVQFTVGFGSHASLAAGVEYVTTAPLALVASATIGAGHVSVGAIVSVTLTVRVLWIAWLPLASVAS